MAARRAGTAAGPYLSSRLPDSLPRQAPATIALFDELRRNGFIEGQNLAVIPDGFEADTEHPRELAAALVKAALDAIITGPAPPLRVFQCITHTIDRHERRHGCGGTGCFARPARWQHHGYQFAVTRT
jgi:hypothetical protein